MMRWHWTNHEVILSPLTNHESRSNRINTLKIEADQSRNAWLSRLCSRSFLGLQLLKPRVKMLD